MIDKNGYLKIIDFGISQDLKVSKKLYDGGTPGWISPEVINRQRYSYQTDFFAVGILMIRLIMGKNPFENKLDKELLKKEMKEKQIKIDYDSLP